MARIETYANDNNVTLGDKIIGTDELDNSTKNFTVGDVVGLANSLATDTTYDYGATGAAGNINIALTGSDATNDVVTVQAGANITLTDNGGNTFTIDAAGSIDTNTTYDFGAVGAAGNISFAVTGSNNTNDVVVMQAGTNITLTDNGSNTFTIDAAGGVGANTTYDLTSVVAGGDAYITLAGSDNTNDAVVIHPGANVSFTSPGVGEFTIDVAQNPAYSWSLSSDSGALNPVPSATTVTVEGGDGISTSISGNTLTISGVLEEKLVQSLGGDITVNAGGTSDVIFRNVVQGGKDITAHSVWYNPTSFVLNGYIVQVPASAPSTLYARLAIGALIDAGGNNQDMTFSLMKSTSGTTTVLKAVDFESNKAGVHPFSFFSYLPLEPGSNYWIAVSSTTGGVTLQAESQVEWVIQN